MRFPTFIPGMNRSSIPDAPPPTDNVAASGDAAAAAPQLPPANRANSGKAAWLSITRNLAGATPKIADATTSAIIHVHVARTGAGLIDLKQNVSPNTARVLLKRFGFQYGDFNDLKKNIDTLAALFPNAKSAAGKDFRILNKQFTQEYSAFFSEPDFKKHQQFFLNLSKEFKERPPTAPVAPSAQSKPAAAPAPSPTQLLEKKFYDSLELVPRVTREAVQFETHAPEAANFQHQYAAPAQASQIKQAIRPVSDFGTPVSNIGGGDCLFHALAGKNLSLEEIMVIRADVAHVKRRAPETGIPNSHHLAAALSQTQSLGLDQVLALMDRRDSIPNEVYANYQAIPGTYAGEDELMQWTTIKENKKKVLVIDQDGTLASYFGGNKKTVAPHDLEEQVKKADILLYKTPAHWEKIDRSPEWTPLPVARRTVRFNLAAEA